LDKSRIIIALLIVLFFPILALSTYKNPVCEKNELGIPLWEGSWYNIPESFKKDVNVTGRLSVEEYPVPIFGIAIPVNQQVKYVKRNIVVLDSDTNFFLASSERAIIITDNSYDYLVDGTRISNVTLAALRRHEASVKGYAFYIKANQTKYTILVVEKVNIYGDTNRIRYPIMVNWAGYSSLQTLTENSRLIILGYVNGPAYSGIDGIPYTEYAVTVEKFIKIPEENEFYEPDTQEIIIHVAMFGAETIDSIYESRMNPLLKPNERVILFLNGPDKNGNYGFPGPYGRYHVIQNRVYSLDVIYPDKFDNAALSTKVEGVSLNFFIDLIKYYSITEIKSPQ